jgi:magnesium transporter
MGLVECIANSRAWQGGQVIDHEVTPAELTQDLVDGRLLWLDLLRPTPSALQELAGLLGLGRTAVEDILAPYERPKLTHHGDSLFFTVYASALDDSGQLVTHRISAVQFRSALITIRLDDQFPVQELLGRWEEDSQLLASGVGALTHGLLDYVVDSHFDTIQVLDDRLEDMEDQLFLEQQSHGAFAREAYNFRKSLVTLRRVVLPMREVVSVLIRHRQEDDPLFHWYDDLYDHVLRASEWTDSLREVINTMFETNLSLQDSRLNLVMKKLAAWAAIIAVPTAITGWFGQNLPYPGFAEMSGLWLSVISIVAFSTILYLLFKRRDWL